MILIIEVKITKIEILPGKKMITRASGSPVTIYSGQQTDIGQ